MQKKLTLLSFISVFLLITACVTQTESNNTSNKPINEKDEPLELPIPESYVDFKNKPDFKISYAKLDKANKALADNRQALVTDLNTRIKVGEIFLEAAKAGRPEAQILYGAGLERGVFSAKKDYEGAFFWAKKAAQKNSATGMNLLANIYTDSPQHKNLSKAVYWHRKAAIYGSNHSIAELGELYFVRKGVAKDKKKTFLLLKLAIAKGDTRRSTRLAFATLQNKYGQNEQETLKAIELAKKKTIDASDIVDEKLAFSLTQKLAESDDGLFMYLHAFDLLQKKKDISGAIKWAKLSAKQDIPKAMGLLGWIYQYEESVQDLDLAFQYYKKGSDLGYATSTSRLGLMYYKGIGVQQDVQKAFWLFSEALKSDDNIARKNLGNIFSDHAKNLSHKRLALRMLEDTVAYLKRN